MKKLSLVLCVLLACSLMLLTACQGGDPQSTDGSGGTQGRYVETDITPPEADGQVLKSFLMEDGTIRCYTSGLLDMYESKDGGESWTHTPGPGASNEELAGATDYTLLEDGSLLAGLADDTGYQLRSLVKVAPDGTTEPYPLEDLDKLIAEGNPMMLSQLKALPGGRLLLGYTSGGFSAEAPGEGEDTSGSEPPADESQPDASAADEGGQGMIFNASVDERLNKTALYDSATGKEIANLSDWQGLAATADEENLYLLDFEGNVTARKLADGSPVSNYSARIPTEQFSFAQALGRGKDGELLAVEGKRLLETKSGGDAEVLLEGGSYSFGAPGAMVEFIDLTPDGSILLGMQGSNGSKLYKYTWDENAKVDPAQTLKIWSLKDSPTLRAAITAFRQKYPDATIDYEVALNEEGMTAEDAIKNLNTRLVSGDGPDIILLDGCPMESFADKGVLADLSKLLDTGDMYENLKKPFETDKGTFYLPMDMMIPTLFGQADQLDANTLADLVKKVEAGKDRPDTSSVNEEDVFSAMPGEERPVLDFQDLREAYDLLWNTSSPNIINGEGLDKDALGAFLTNLKAMSDKYKLTEEGGAMGSVAFATDGSDTQAIKGSPIAYSMQRALLAGANVGDLVGLQFIAGPPNTELKAFPGLTEGAWLPGSIAGINADSKVIDFAAEFLQTMLGDEVQGARAGGGLPVTEKGLIKQVDSVQRMLEEQSKETGVKEEFNIDLTPLIESLKQPVLTENVLTETVWTTAEKLCLGEVDLEGAVSQIEQDVKTYLAERQ